MGAYPGQPVMLHGTRYQFVLSGRLFYKVRKDVQKSTSAALSKDLKCLRMLGKFLGVPRDVWPVQPPQEWRQQEKIPTPEEVYATLHTHYLPDWKGAGAIEDAWVRHVLALHWGVGLRSPKEHWVLPVDAYGPGTGFLDVIEPKKRYRERRLYLEPTWLAKSHARPSLDSWLRWRDKLNPSGSAMFPNPVTGKDFPTPAAFKRHLDQLVKPVFPWFHGYLTRHWCVYARIIDAGFTDTAYNAVAEWFGHRRSDMTRDVYGPAARAYSKSPAYGQDWLARAFCKPRLRQPKEPTHQPSA